MGSQSGASGRPRPTERLAKSGRPKAAPTVSTGPYAKTKPFPSSVICFANATFPQGKAFGRLIAAPTVHRKPVGARFKNPPSSVTASPCPPTPFGLRPFPPDRGNRPSPLEGEGYLYRERWLRKLRRKHGTAPKANFANAGPSGPAGVQTRTQILRAGNYLPTQRDNPRKRGPGKGDYEHEVLIWSRPRRRFGDFAAAGKVTRRPQAAKLPCKNSDPGDNSRRKIV